MRRVTAVISCGCLTLDWMDTVFAPVPKPCTDVLPQCRCDPSCRRRDEFRVDWEGVGKKSVLVCRVVVVSLVCLAMPISCR